eukprot:7751661-Pyramimonas_sp.AAC.1
MEATVPQAFDIADNVNFTEPANRTIFVANTIETVSINEVQSCVQSSLFAAGFDNSQWKFVGSSPAKRARVQFQRSGSVAAIHLVHAVRHLEQADGRWRPWLPEATLLCILGLAISPTVGPRTGVIEFR